MAGFPADAAALAASLAAIVLSICYTWVSQLLFTADLMRGSPMYAW